MGGNRSELNHGKTRDSLEIAEVQRHDFVAEMQCRRADQQILERKLDTNRFLLAFDAPGQPRDVERHRMYRDVARKPLDELQPSLLLRLGLRAIGSMHQLGNSHHGDADFDLTLNCLHLFKDFPNGMASAFGSDNDT